MRLRPTPNWLKTVVYKLLGFFLLLLVCFFFTIICKTLSDYSLQFFLAIVLQTSFSFSDICYIMEYPIPEKQVAAKVMMTCFIIHFLICV